MAIRRESVLGDITGKIGPVVFSRWKTVDVVKSLPSRSRKKKISEKRLTRRALFNRVTSFLRIIGKDILSKGYPLNKGMKGSAFNLATSYHLEHAVKGQYPTIELDPEQVKLSRPLLSTEESWNPVISAQPGRLLEVKWELNPFPDKSASLDDEAVIVFYFPSMASIETSAGRGIVRSSLTYQVAMPRAFQGKEAWCWLFFVSADGKRVSETEYLGRVTIQE